MESNIKYEDKTPSLSYNKNEIKQLTHLDPEGNARMVDVSLKKPLFRKAVAEGFIHLQKTTLELIRNNLMKKGDVLTVAQIAGITAAKKTGEMIPLCHPLPLTHAEVKTIVEEEGVRVSSSVSCYGQTGVEMEALTAVSVALLTLYDMCKAVDKNMILSDIHLVEKIKKEYHC